MYQQWLQAIGLLLGGFGFALIALECFAATAKMRNNVTLVARNLERP
jgi:hypothetical protein